VGTDLREIFFEPPRNAEGRVVVFTWSPPGTPSEAEEAISALERECVVLKAALTQHPLAAAAARSD